MANDLTTNPRIVDVVVTAGATVDMITSPTRVNLIQWVNLGSGEIADGSDLTLSINAMSVNIKAQGTPREVAYEASFPNGMLISYLNVGLMDKGAVLVWTV